MKIKNLHIAQILLLLAGNIVAWYAVYSDFARFYGIYGTVFRVRDCVVPNPVITPCFYGAWAFLAGLVLAILVWRSSSSQRQAQYQKILFWLLLAGTIFAWSNFGYELVKFYLINAAQPSIGCSGRLVKNPFLTPCFYGSALFLLSFITTLFIKNKKDE